MGRGFQACVVGLCMVATSASAQSATIVMTASSTQVAVGESFQLQVQAHVTGGQAQNIDMPSLEDFHIVERRVARPMQFSFGFGGQTQVMQATIVHDYTLQATRAGQFEIGPAVVKLGRQRFASNALTINVSPGRGAHAPRTPGAPQPILQPPRQPALPSGFPFQIPGLRTPAGPTNGPTAAPPTGNLDGAVYDASAFLRTVVDNPQPYVGEQITVTLYLYSRASAEGAVLGREPDTDGFWIQNLISPDRRFPNHRQNVNGAPFAVAVLRRFAAFPMRAGDLEIGPATATLQPSIFDRFGGAGPMERGGVAVPVHVRPLPARGRAAQGRIHVGEFTLQTSLDRSQVATGDAVTLTATLQGFGNVRDVQLSLAAIDGLRALEPQIRDQLNVVNDRVGGTRVWEWLLIPEREGQYEIPALSVETFQPDRATYTTVASSPLTLTAAGNAVTELSDDVETSDRASEQQMALGPIRTRSEFERGHQPVSGSAFYAWALGAPPLAWLGLLLFGFARRRAFERERSGAPKRALRAALARLGAAETAAGRRDAGACYAEIRQGLTDILEAKLAEPLGSHTYPKLRAYLMHRGMDAALAAHVVEEIEGAEFARFSAAAASGDELTRCVERARKLSKTLQRFEPTDRGDA